MTAQLIHKSSFFTLEALADALAHHVLRNQIWEDVLVSVEKPHTYAMCEGPGAEVFRSRVNIEAKGD